jgi:hypothetical protein
MSPAWRNRTNCFVRIAHNNGLASRRRPRCGSSAFPRCRPIALTLPVEAPTPRQSSSSHVHVAVHLEVHVHVNVDVDINAPVSGATRDHGAVERPPGRSAGFRRDGGGRCSARGMTLAGAPTTFGTARHGRGPYIERAETCLLGVRARIDEARRPTTPRSRSRAGRGAHNVTRGRHRGTTPRRSN